MNRRLSSRPSTMGGRVRLAAGAVAWFAGALAASQAQQIYPNGSEQGNARFGAFPAITINCRSYTLGPGARVLDSQRRLVLTAGLDGIESPVVFQQDAQGNVFRVWLISAAQAKQSTLPKAPSDCGLFGGE